MVALTDLRNDTVHRQPISRLFYKVGPRFDTEYIETTHFEWTHTTDEHANIVVTYKVGQEGPTISRPPICEWFLEIPDEVPALVACRHGLEVLDKMLREWNMVLQAG